MMDDRNFNFGVTILTDSAPLIGDFAEHFGCYLYRFPLNPDKRTSESELKI